MATLSPQQHKAVELIEDWRRKKRSSPHFYLGGYAGTGKSTLVRHILDNMPSNDRNSTLVMAPTGKAADVLRKKGIVGACTVHSAIYSPISPTAQRIEDLRILLSTPEITPVEKAEYEKELGGLLSNDGPAFAKGSKDFLENVKLFICDEFSMVGSAMYHDIIAHDIPLLCIGDPAQLSPVKDGGLPFGPDFVLTEIHRQAADNPIIKLAHMAKNGQHIPLGVYGDCRVINKSHYDRDMLIEHDQILCWKNETRRGLNEIVRMHTGREGTFPLSGERLVCKKNDPERQLWNGAMYNATDDAKEFGKLVTCDVFNGVTNLEGLELYHVPFIEYKRKVPKIEHLSYNERRGLAEFDFGYAITAHSAQGSEWDSVFIVDETNAMFDGSEANWLYTAMTRGAKRITLYRPYG